jgi:hypothetical protein|tara:strand:- start:446 stop:670 length:225 start_codon:yes stop_codon:yes gene_type:complete
MSEINGNEVKYYLLQKGENEKKIIAVTKETKSYIHGILIYTESSEKINKNIRLSKDLISKFIDQYDFTKTLSLD